MTMSALHKPFPKFLDAVIAPTKNDDVDSGFDINSIWVDTVKKEVFTCIDNSAGAAIWKLSVLGSDFGEYSGFVNRTDSEISFNDTTRTFTIQPKSPSIEYDYYVQGTKYTKNSTENLAIDGADAEGIWYFYFDGDVLTATQTFNFTILYAKAFIGTIYWDETNDVVIMLNEERHGIVMDWRTHSYHHQTTGCLLGSGFEVEPLFELGIGDGSSATHGQISLSGGTIWDEDIDISISHALTADEIFEQTLTTPQAKIPVYYKSGAGLWRRDVTTKYPFKSSGGTGRIPYNLNTNGTWTTPDVSLDEGFIAVWVLATNSISEPVISLLGQREDDSFAEAQRTNQYADLDLTGLPAAEFRPLYRILVKTDSNYTSTEGILYQIKDIRYSTILDIPARNYSDIEYFTLLNLFHTMAEAHTENVFLRESLHNMYIDTFKDSVYIESLHGTILTGDSCILALNPLYKGESAIIEDFESTSPLRICHFADCSLLSWATDNTYWTDGSGYSVSPYAGTYMGRIARGANPGSSLAFWTCLLSDSFVGDYTNMKNVHLWINVPSLPANTNLPISLHLRGSTGTGEFYTSHQTISSATSGWEHFEFNVQNCDFLPNLTELGVAIGSGLNNTVDIEIFVDEINYTYGDVQVSHGYFKRTPLTTTFDIIETLTDRKTLAPVEIGYVENHISLDGGVHFKENISISTFINSKGNGEIATPDKEFKEDIIFTHDATINWKYDAPSGDESLSMLHPYKGTDDVNVSSHAHHLFEDDMSVDSTGDYTVTNDSGTLTFNTDHYEIEEGGVSNQTHAYLAPTNDFDTEQNIEAIVSLKDFDSAAILGYQTAAICCRTTNKTLVGYWAGIHHNGINIRFVIGKNITVITTGTYDAPVQGTEYHIQLSTFDNGVDVDVSARFCSADGTTCYETIFLKDLAGATPIVNGGIGFFGGTIDGNGEQMLATFRNFVEHYGYGEYSLVANTPDYISFLTGREPSVDITLDNVTSFDVDEIVTQAVTGATGIILSVSGVIITVREINSRFDDTNTITCIGGSATPSLLDSTIIKASYFKPFVGDWDNKRSLVIVAHFHKNLDVALHSTSPEIDDFIQIAKVTEV